MDLDSHLSEEIKEEAEESVCPRHLTISEKIPNLEHRSEEWWSEESEVVTNQFSVETTQEMTEEEEFSTQTIKETQTFVIVGVLDPRTDEHISIYRAVADGIVSQTEGIYKDPITGETMPIPEAMNRGLILVEFTNRKVEAGDLIRKGILRTTTRKDTMSYSVSSVTDPVTGRKISVTEAVRRGIIDQAKGQYINPLTGETMTLTEAIENGLLNVKEVDPEDVQSYPDLTDGPEAFAESQLRDTNLEVHGIRDPSTGRYITLEEAVQKGIVDPEKGLYRNTVTGVELPLAEALEKGYVKVSLADPNTDAGSPNILNAGIFAVNSQTPLEDIQEIITSSLTEEALPSVDVNHMVYSKVKGNLDSSLKGIKDPATGREMTIGEAFEAGILTVSPLMIQNANGDKFSLMDAVSMGLMDVNTAKELLKALEPYSLHKLIEDHSLDTASGSFIDPETGKVMTLSEAVACEKLDPDKVFYTDIPACTVSSLSSAFENKKWDAESGKLFDPKSGRDVSLSQAIQNKLLDPKVDPEKLCEQMAAMKFLKSSMDTRNRGIKNTSTGDDLTIEGAVAAGILDLCDVSYVDPSTEQSMPLSDAVRADLVDSKTAKELLAALATGSLRGLLDAGKIDPNTGRFIHPDTKRKMTIKEAIDSGHLDPNSVFFVDPSTGNPTSLAAAIKEGKFNPVTGKFKDPLSGLDISIANAIKKGIVEPHIDPDKLIEEKGPLKELLDGGKVNAQNSTFVTPQGEEMTLKAAMAAGYVTPDSTIRVDPKTGKLYSAGNTDLVDALVNTSNELEWLGGVEKVLAAHEKPSEELDTLKSQIQSHEVSGNQDTHISTTILTLLC